MSDIRQWYDGEVPCFDPECTDREGARSVAEPDGDTDIRFYVCGVCHSEFGHQRVPQQVITADGSGGYCQIGVPEALRARGSFAPPPKPEPVLLRIGFGPPAE